MILSLCFLFVLTGTLYYQFREFNIRNNELCKYNDTNQQITLYGIVSKEPDIRNDKIKLEIRVKQLIINDKNIEISGKVLVTANRYSKYNYRDNLEITGDLKAPQVFEDFNYEGYLNKEGIVSVIYWPKIRKISEGEGNVVFKNIILFKDQLRQVIYRNLSPPRRTILASMILGDKKRMSEDLKKKLSVAGVRHITAISGMHITILSVVLMQLLIGIGFWRKQAFFATISCLTLFIIMIGLPSSAVRAGIMVGLFLLAQALGRKSSSRRIIVFTATGILIANPLLLRFDIGFQLSFLAVLGIIFLNPFFQNLLKKIPESSFLNLRSVISMTLSAQIFTLPILIYNFGTISLIAPVANVLILPFLPFVIGSGFLFGLSGLIYQPIGQVLSWPCWLILTYIIKLVEWFSSQSFASIVINNVHPFWLGIFYLILVIIILRLNKKYEPSFLNY